MATRIGFKYELGAHKNRSLVQKCCCLFFHVSEMRVLL